MGKLKHSGAKGTGPGRKLTPQALSTTSANLWQLLGRRAPYP